MSGDYLPGLIRAYPLELPGKEVIPVNPLQLNAANFAGHG
jgi:hypothetical protein